MSTDVFVRGPVCLGIDLVDVARIRRLVQRFFDDGLEYIFSPFEREQAEAHRHPDRVYAVCFGAKEAVGKALWCGMAGIEWTDIEATVGERGLKVTVSGVASELAHARGVRTWLAAWSRVGELAFVQVMGG